jgi:hypothetical protein
MITNYKNPKSQHLGSLKKNHVLMYVPLVVSNEKSCYFRMGRSSNVVEEYTKASQLHEE